MSALEHAKAMGVEAVMEKTAAAGIKEYGVYHRDLAEKWKEILREAEGPVKVGAALNNSDTARVLLGMLETDLEKILDGIDVTAYVLGAEEKILQLPEEEEALKEKIAPEAEKHGISVVNAFVKVREYRGHALHHIETMAAVADLMNDSYEPGVHIAVCREGKTGELKKVPFGTRLADAADLSGAKAVEVGSHLYTPGAAQELVIDGDLNTGNGVITVIPESACLMQEGEARLLASRKNGCGKCTFCREGLYQLYAHMTDITSGKGKKEGLDMMKEIGEAMEFSCACSVGTTGADFALDSMKYFMDEFDAHIKKKNCPAGVCTCFMTIYIDPNACEGCEDCADVCPEDCIEGKACYIHMIDDFDCTKCGKCIEACEYDAIIKTTGRVPKLPTRLVKCGKFKKR